MEEKTVKPITNTTTPVVASTPPVTSKESTPETVKLTDLPNETKPETSDPTNFDTIIPSEPYYMDPLFYEVANYFSINQEDYAAAKYKLSDIVEYVIREGKSNKPEDVLMGLRRLEERVQPPSWDEKRYTNIYRYVRLAAKEQSIRQAMKAFEKGARV